MGMICQRAGGIQESLPAAMAEETLFFFGMAIFDNMCVPAMRTCRPVRQLLVSRNDSQHKADDPFDVRFTKGFDAVKQGCNFILALVNIYVGAARKCHKHDILI